MPKKNRQRRIRTLGLPGLKASGKSKFEFTITWKTSGTELQISGSPRGYDLVVPESKEQERWMRKVEKDFGGSVKEVWYCLWEFENNSAADQFMKMISEYIVEEEDL